MRPSFPPSHSTRSLLCAGDLVSRAKAWRSGLSEDCGCALIVDVQGRSIAEVHRRALAVGPLGRLLTFAQAVHLMSAAQQLLALLEEVVRASGDGTEPSVLPNGLRERALALLARCR